MQCSLRISSTSGGGRIKPMLEITPCQRWSMAVVQLCCGAVHFLRQWIPAAWAEKDGFDNVLGHPEQKIDAICEEASGWVSMDLPTGQQSQPCLSLPKLGFRSCLEHSREAVWFAWLKSGR